MNEYFLEERGLYYRTNRFSAARPTFVFVHGLSGSSSAWAPYEARFENDFNVVTFDLRGHGKSLKPWRYENYSMRHFAEDLDALLAHLHIEKCILIAHSFATLFAFDFLGRHPEKIGRLVLLSPSAHIGTRVIEKILNILLIPLPLLQYLPQRRTRGWHVDYSYFPDSGDWNLRRMWADVRNTTLRVYLFCTRQVQDADYEAVLPRISVPTLLIHGTSDTIFPVRNSIMMKEKIPRSRLILVENADHILVLNNADEVSDAIEAFLREVY